MEFGGSKEDKEGDTDEQNIQKKFSFIISVKAIPINLASLTGYQFICRTSTSPSRKQIVNRLINNTEHIIFWLCYFNT